MNLRATTLTLTSTLALAAMLGCSHPYPAAPPPGIAMAPAAALRSPIEQPPAPTNEPYDCGPPVAIGPDITVATPQPDDMQAAVYSESAAALHELAHRVTIAGNEFQRTGNANAARCVVTLLADVALHHGMDGYIADFPAWKQQNITLRAVSIAWLKILPANAATHEQAGLITAWMRDIVHNERAEFSQARCARDGCPIDGHSGVGVAVAAAAIAIATQDHGLFHWAIDRYRTTVVNIEDRGMIRWDIQRHDALRYNLEAAAGLVQLAEFGEANNIPMYDFANGRLHLLVHTVARGILDPGPFAEAAHWSQRMPKKLEPWEISWAGTYASRFPEPVLTSLMQQAGPASADMWAADPWDDGADTANHIGETH
jgi:poly(beta-D-mannuronate) lyase